MIVFISKDGDNSPFVESLIRRNFVEGGLRESALTQALGLFTRFFKGESKTIINSMITAIRSNSPGKLKSDIANYSRVRISMV
jgi:hypothetical protein